MQTKKRWLTVGLLAGACELVVWQLGGTSRMQNHVEAKAALQQPSAARTSARERGQSSVSDHAAHSGAESSSSVGFVPAAGPPPQGRIVLGAPDEATFREMSAVIEYFKLKPVPTHGQVHSVGDGIDSSDRNAPVPPNTPFSRFRYEYEKHETTWLQSELEWASQEITRLESEQPMTSEASSALSLVKRRQRAMSSILEERARQQALHERYQHVDVTLTPPKARDGV